MAEGRPLGEASGGDRGFWDRLGQDEGLMPVHLPMGVNAAGQGPENDSEAHHWVCWCGDTECPLALALGHAWRSGRMSRVSTCGGCRGEGRHRRWCPAAVGRMASIYGPMAEQLNEMGDVVGPNNMGISNKLWALSSEMREWAKTMLPEDGPTY